MMKVETLQRRISLPCTASLLLCAGTLAVPAFGQPAAYTFTLIATLGKPAPAGGNHINDFEPGSINNRGDLIYGTDLDTDPFGEGVFLRRAGGTVEQELAHVAGSAPGGGVFDFLLFGQATLNDSGDGAFAFSLLPYSTDGVSSGVYRYSHINGAVTPVIVPGTPAPAPNKGTFLGAGFNTSLNNGGDLVFTGTLAPGIQGVFKADKLDHITSVVSPGDAAPGKHTFESAGNSAWINGGGDVAFVAHLPGENPAISSIYLKDGSKGTITSVAHAGDPAPGGGTFRAAYSPVINDSGDIVFQGDLSAAPAQYVQQGVYLYSKGKLTAVAKPGDAMPGGGQFQTTAFFPNELHINNAGEVVFGAALTEDKNGDGVPDTGVYVWSKGSTRLVARTGTVMPRIGTIQHLVFGAIVIPVPPSFIANSGAINNDRGQVFFGATLTDRSGVLLVATPY
jgi:hypothetical protein